jgi:hypothetical protein
MKAETSTTLTTPAAQRPNIGHLLWNIKILLTTLLPMAIP